MTFHYPEKTTFNYLVPILPDLSLYKQEQIDIHTDVFFKKIGLQSSCFFEKILKGHFKHFLEQENFFTEEMDMYL